MGKGTTYIPVIGLEIHAELNTRTKMFCDCLNDPTEIEPNKNICPVCLAHPGTLPVANKEAIESMIKIGMAVGGETPAVSKFDRKNYFYPDIPKGYQISQYDMPFVFGGTLAGVKLTRVHLEEDTGRLQHVEGGPSSPAARSGRPTSLVDYNRAGVPLMELVTEPDIREVEKIGEFGRELQLVLRYLGVSDADMEKGQMRVEVNLSLGTIVDGELKFGTKVEVKNIASFKMAEAAARYEIERQREVLESGGEISQETRGWDDPNKRTVSQRKKESSHDYRYFPEPDLPVIDLSQFDFSRLKREIPELPQAKRMRLKKEYGLTDDQVELLVFDRPLAEFFEGVISELHEEREAPLEKTVPLAINYLTSDLKGLMVADGKVDVADTRVTAENLADLVELIALDKLTSRTAKDILKTMYETGGDPTEIMKTESLEQVSDEGALREMAQGIIATHPGPVADYKKGKETALMFFVGQAMKELRGKGNPAMLQQIFKDLLT
ncbi:MAG: Asp-tRNA(Asn)/Glu-tRNA(Gln) amidotransferase subunit GatB [Candidatus Harrisonbacteria bacterium CG10_big_fil_rev_8_21_14_0_10_49_15]|uniref:Aspartyl/glutamyl-tRNA(Asn/Gln) amidotransferase subunit B n=1 Tax=Candidatus Harrisonbacteria bacterium CG10_big_fil_rev_8_21_14_0_10_49_15 TaxID=1974587 RepID=A0A2H0UM17_9BACT|nr:MAG: Asp-tRNA(Asn)/Glu-tRNA(Gln) amidotransferase subunit GatB [Candidatus Harrisonbacteria bacterium CG10_big_fil_rev_8_21_14_0_10_49_15]